MIMEFLLEMKSVQKKVLKVFYNQESCSFMMQDICDEDNTQYFDLDLGVIPPKYLEVIGNIYENKELLEVE